MDIRIGIANTPREISFESSETAGEIEKTVAAALDAKSSYLTLRDDKGKVYVIPTATLAYVEIGSDASRRVGFVA
ncbi:MAG: ATP-binding protein [Microbacteriaceae bacterium]|nr:ATP-binding protein [Microbacteriaceae bacterium]